jgi:hypoxanthine phosphoribosyltransferase
MNPMDVQQIKAVLAGAECLVTPDAMEAAYARMADALNALYADTCPLVLCVMNGGLIPAGKLLHRLDFPLELDYVHATRYGAQTQGSRLNWKRYPDTPLAARDVLVIDDILDEGYTLLAIREWCLANGAFSVRIAVPVDKVHDRRAPGIQADVVGLTVPDRYIFGEGMDYKGYFRNLNGIFALRESAAS